MKINKSIYLLSVILLFSFLLRIINLNWDGAYSFQPDERMIGMVAEKLNWDWENFFSPNSTMNPDFFAYGSFPIYLLWLAKESFVLFFNQRLVFDEVLNLGRVLSALTDTTTVLVIFLLVKKLFIQNKAQIAFFSAGIYAILILPIQLSHYYAVDTLLNLGFWTAIYLAIKHADKRSRLKLFLLGVVLGISIATKITGLILILPITVYLLLTNKTSLTNRNKEFVYLLLITLIIFATLMPYAFIDWENFYSQIKDQSKLFYNAYAFPYTLQYVDTYPYIYFLKNIFFWGSGLVTSSLSVLGILIFLIKNLKAKPKIDLNIGLVIIVILIYFVYMGYSEVKFNRYMLPVYPLIAITAGYGVVNIISRLKGSVRRSSIVIIFVALAIQPSAFITTYFQTPTRLSASEWINKNVAAGSTIAIEHWDDQVPVNNGAKYNFVELKIYDQPDDQTKWRNINQLLENTDFIVIASNRLYRPVQKLKNCDEFRVCYPIASNYYQRLFDNNTNFKKIAEFENMMKIPLTNMIIDDQNSDESFTVYERPKVIIFKKIKK